MQLSHVALWTNNLERLRDFYVTWFGGRSNEKYENPAKGFASYFISFKGATSLEIMQRTDITAPMPASCIGLTHIAFHVGSADNVNEQVERLRAAGYTIAGEPRFTGDGYYEGLVLDPDGNAVEITAYREAEVSRALFPPYDLLLLADPEREKVDAYLPLSDCFVATLREQIVGVIVVQKQDNDTAEIMNLAVSEHFQRRGIARKLLRYVVSQWAAEQRVGRLLIRTGTSAPAPFMLYQQEGFNLIDVVYDYFPGHYSEPIFENGIQCRHQLVLERKNN